MRKLLVIATIAMIGVLLVPSAIALADQNYHTERLSLNVVDDGHSLRNGMVVNIHPNGPNNGAIELYKLNGANPNTDYEVWWEIDGMGEIPTNAWAYPDDPNPNEIDASPVVVHTNKKGNGHVSYKITRDYQVAMGFVGFDGMVKWLFKADGVTAFETDWTHVTVD